MDSIELLRRLSEAHGPSGFEDEVREHIWKTLANDVDEIRSDALGNLIVRRRANSETAPVLLIDAHMDEVGFVVSHIEPTGFLRLAPLGGWDERVLPGQRLELRTREGKKYIGVIGTTPPHIQTGDDKKSPPTMESLFVDIGAASEQEVADWGIRLGDSLVPAQSFVELPNGVCAGKAFDDRVGCALLVELFKELTNLPRLGIEIVGLFSTFEELNARGAMVGTFGIAPTFALVLEATVAADVPGVPEARCPTRFGGGAAITLMDKYTHCHPRLVRVLELIAEREKIPYQFKRPIFGGTNAARIHTTRAGVPTATLSVPCRYIHSATSLIRLSDYEATRNLLRAFVLEAEKISAEVTS